MIHPKQIDQDSIIATAQLTEEQVRVAVVEYLLKSEELKEAIEGKATRAVTQWQTSKWSDPNGSCIFCRRS